PGPGRRGSGAGRPGVRGREAVPLRAMEVGMQQTWMEIILTAVHDVGRRLAYVTPRLLAALTLVAIGWVVAVAVRRLATRLLGAADLDGRCRRPGLSMT